ncbi:pilus assembly protein PilP [Halochromatium glycolicum]|nr:pilus assembly protein PilP [Halochromatium glycolicum]
MMPERPGLLPIWTVLAALSWLLTSCADPDLAQLETYATRIKAREPGPIEPVPEIPPVTTYVYDPDERRDPFTMDDQSAEVAQQGLNGLAPDPTRRKEPLEAYSLDALRMVGTLEQDQRRWALITTPDGRLHRVQVGNFLGRNNGEIVKIKPDQLELTELVEEQPGQWQQRQASMALKD